MWNGDCVEKSEMGHIAVCDAGPRTPHEVLALLQMIPPQSTLYIWPSLLDEIIEQVRKDFGLQV